MSYTIICLNIHCIKNTGKQDPVYRLFLNDQLIIERKFWPSSPEYFIQEQITLNDDNENHVVWVKNVFGDRGRIRVDQVNFFDGDTRDLLKLPFDCLNGRYSFKLPKR
jgi:hypothetical protein